MDGKQARRTGSSSPLGMMFDHGCDAVTTFLFASGLGTVVGLDSIEWFSLLWLMISFPFFLNTWEEYYVGELNFPLIHGVSEGTLIACFAMHLSGFYGMDFWLTKINLFGLITLQANHIIVLCCFTAGLGFGTYSLINVIRTYKEKRHDALHNLLIFISLVSTLAIVVLFTDDSQILKYHPKILIILYGFAFAKLVGHLQLAHVCDSEFMQYRKSMLISFFVMANTTLLKHFFGINLINIDYLIIAFLLLHIVVWIHFAYYLTEELCQTLGIYRFSTKKRNLEKKN
jgi:ethanolaminephosphotransferase